MRESFAGMRQNTQKYDRKSMIRSGGLIIHEVSEQIHFAAT
jgi:hypothetical protein